MRYNLKNRPKHYGKDWEIIEAWFVGFERELREMMVNAKFGITKTLIREVLGE